MKTLYTMVSMGISTTIFRADTAVSPALMRILPKSDSILRFECNYLVSA